MPRVLNARTLLLKPNVVPPGAVYIGRHTRNGWRASRWGNPFRLGKDGTSAEVIGRYRAWLCDQPDLMAALPELAGRDLVYWCAPEPCHGDVLLAMANAASGP
jgi:hypothetical protein